MNNYNDNYWQLYITGEARCWYTIPIINLAKSKMVLDKNSTDIQKMIMLIYVILGNVIYCTKMQQLLHSLHILGIYNTVVVYDFQINS